MAPPFNIDLGLGSGRLTSTTSRRYWDWNPSNDRDFIGLPVTTISAAPSNQVQWTQEVRWAGDLSRKVNLVVGGFGFHQALDSNPSFKQEQGSAAARLLLAPSADAATPGPARRLRLRPVHEVPQHQRGALRPGGVAGDQSAAAAAGSALQLRPEGTWTSSSRSTAACRRPTRRSSRCSGRCWRRSSTPPTWTTPTCRASSPRPTRSRARSTRTRPTRPASSPSAST